MTRLDDATFASAFQSLRTLLPGQVVLNEEDTEACDDAQYAELVRAARAALLALEVNDEGEIIVSDRRIVRMEVRASKGELGDGEGGPEIQVRVVFETDGTEHSRVMTLCPACNDYDQIFGEWALTCMTEEERQEVLHFARKYLGLE